MFHLNPYITYKCAKNEGTSSLFWMFLARFLVLVKLHKPICNLIEPYYNKYKFKREVK